MLRTDIKTIKYVKEGMKILMKKRIIKQAFTKSLPVLAGYIVLGIGFGILMNNAG